MPERFDICDLHDSLHSEALLRLNNASARETSLLTPKRFDQLIRSAHVALFVPPAVALLLAFEDRADFAIAAMIAEGSRTIRTAIRSGHSP